MTDAEVIAAIRANHLKANISDHEGNPIPGQRSEMHWERAWVDCGGTIFGAGPYVKLPITLRYDPPVELAGKVWKEDEIVIRVYAPERLRKKLAAQWTTQPLPSDS